MTTLTGPRWRRPSAAVAVGAGLLLLAALLVALGVLARQPGYPGPSRCSSRCRRRPPGLVVAWQPAAQPIGWLLLGVSVPGGELRQRRYDAVYRLGRHPAGAGPGGA